MSPFEKIRQLYREEPEDNPFEWYLEQHHLRGYVFSTPDFFIMGLPCVRQELLDGYSSLSVPRGKPDTWFISAMAGNMQKAWSIQPYELPWIAFERGKPAQKRLMICETSRIRGHTL